MTKGDTTEILEFGIDSGTFWIGDIGYIIGHPEKYGNDQAWSKVCQQLRNKELPGEIEQGIMFNPGRDGGYKIHVTKDKNGRVRKLEINL